MSRPIGGRRPPQLADVSLDQPRPTATPMPRPAVQQAQQVPATAFKPKQFRQPQVMPTMGIDPRRNIGSPRRPQTTRRQVPQFARNANQQAQRAMLNQRQQAAMFNASLKAEMDLFNKSRQQAGPSGNRQRAAFLASQRQKKRMFNMQQRGADPRQMFRAKQRYDRQMFNRFSPRQATPEQRRAFFAQQAQNRQRFNQQYGNRFRRPQVLRSTNQPRTMPFRGRRPMPFRGRRPMPFRGRGPMPFRGRRRVPRNVMLPFRFRRGRR